jgi:succinylarginine dihydrolase
MKYFEVNFDGIVGPTHNYSGLSFGNIASVKNKQLTSNPKQAALQGLAKMKFLLDLGIPQGFIPPQLRPHIPTLRRLGFSGTDTDILKKTYNESSELLFACCSSSSMWTANAATVSPSADSSDHRLHITPANLSNKLHRSIEAEATQNILKAIFPDPNLHIIHPYLPEGSSLADEGAANHTRFCLDFGSPCVQLIVYGR